MDVFHVLIQVHSVTKRILSELLLSLLFCIITVH